MPSDDAWYILTNYLGRQSWAKMKSTSLWIGTLTGTNESGFNALPAGHRHSTGTFYTLTAGTVWWSTSEVDDSTAFNRGILFSHSFVSRIASHKSSGFSIRCVRD